jgi:hypothetical protein
VRVPFADFNALKLPPGTEHEEDFALLADVFPTVKTLALSQTRILILTYYVITGMAWGTALGK